MIPRESPDGSSGWSDRFWRRLVRNCGIEWLWRFWRHLVRNCGIEWLWMVCVFCTAVCSNCIADIPHRDVVCDWRVLSEEYCFSAVFGVVILIYFRICLRRASSLFLLRGKVSQYMIKIRNILPFCGELMRMFLMLTVAQHMFAVVILTIVKSSVFRRREMTCTIFRLGPFNFPF